jgi:U3 small nucleolar RNA-associated protein 24
MQDCIFYFLVSVVKSYAHFGSRKENQLKQKKKEEEEKAKAVRRVSASISPCDARISSDMLSLSSPQVASSLFLAHNSALVPPYRVLIDTNFINFSLQNKLDLMSGMMDCLYAKCE